MTEQERYEQVDMPFYRSEVAPILPPAVLDFHTHAWRRDQWLGDPFVPGDESPQENGSSVQPKGARYMVTTLEYSAEQLLADGRRIFPDRDYQAVFFGQPTPAADTDLTNSYVAKAARLGDLYPLIITGRNRTPAEQLRREIQERGFLGYKVYLDWLGDDYGDVLVEDLIGSEEMKLADELGLVVLLHVPRSGRLADPDVQRGVREHAARCPNARIVLAHCGRCYLYDEMRAAIAAIRDLGNVYLDTSMVMDPMVLRLVFENMDSRRVLFGTDFPVAAMRGRRVQVMDHWVDVVLNGYPPSAFRVGSNAIHATFMAYEIAAAIRMAGEMAGLDREQVRDVFFENGMAVLRHVADGRQLEAVRSRRIAESVPEWRV